MLAGMLFAGTFGCGLVARARPRLWAPLLGLVAFLPSAALFYGVNDYALRAGVLGWIPVALTQRRQYRPARLPMLAVWLLIALPGILFTYWATGDWRAPAIYCFSHTGFSLTYVVLVLVVVPGLVPLDRYFHWLVACAFTFFVLGGFLQYWTGAPLSFTPSESYNYLAEQGRMVGLFEPSSHSTAVVLNVCFAVVLARRLAGERSGLIHALLVLFAAAIVLCQNRANILSLAATVVVGLVLSGGRRVLAKVAVVALLAATAYASIQLLATNQVERFSDASNIVGRLDIWRSLWADRSAVLTGRLTGIGFFPEAATGSAENYKANYFSYFGENQVLDWLGALGWPITVVLLLVLAAQVRRLYRAARRRVRMRLPPSPIGWGLLLSWVGLTVSYMSNTDSKFLIPLLSGLTVIYVRESRGQPAQAAQPQPAVGAA